LFATHQTDPVEVEVDVTPVHLDSDVPVIEPALPQICVAATIHSTFPGYTQIRLVQPTARLWKGVLEFLS
jgi:hypothetical protein